MTIKIETIKKEVGNNRYELTFTDISRATLDAISKFILDRQQAKIDDEHVNLLVKEGTGILTDMLKTKGLIPTNTKETQHDS